MTHCVDYEGIPKLGSEATRMKRMYVKYQIPCSLRWNFCQQVLPSHHRATLPPEPVFTLPYLNESCYGTLVFRHWFFRSAYLAYFKHLAFLFKCFIIIVIIIILFYLFTYLFTESRYLDIFLCVPRVLVLFFFSILLCPPMPCC